MTGLRRTFTARTTRRQIFAPALLCGHTRIITILLLLLSKWNLCVSAAASAYEFRAFADVLKQQHLQHAIIAYNSDTERTHQQAELLADNALRALLNVASLRFYDVHQVKSAKNYTEFQSLFYHDSPRVGIYVAQLEDVLLQQYVLGSNELSVDTIDAGGYRVRVDAGARFNNSRVWFIMSKQRTVTTALANVRRLMTPLPVNISADITVGIRSDGNNSIKLFDIYKIQKDWLEIEPKGYWCFTESLKLNLRFHQTFVSRRRNFKGLTLIGGIVIREQPAGMDVLEYINSLSYKNFDPMQRKTYQLIKLMEPVFDLSFQPYITETWGTQSPNGSWDGVMNSLLSGEAEFSLCPMRFVMNRVHLIDYTIAVHTEFVFFIFRHPRRNDIRNIFFQPFVEEVWYTVIAIIVITTLLLQLHLHHEKRFFINKDSHFQTRFDYAILSILEAFFMQGPANDAFNATSTRTLIFSVCLFSLLLQQFYGAYIVGSLLAVSPRTITNLEALYNSSLEIGIENIPYNIETFEKTTAPLGSAIYKERVCKNRERNIISIEEGAERIKRGGYAFHVSANRIYYMLKELLTEKEFCDLQDVPFIPPYRIGIGITKSSPFREYFTTSIANFHTSGLLQHNNNQWRLPQMDCSLSQNHEVEVDLQHFLPALIFLISAMLLSLAVLIVEIIYYNLEHSTRFARLCPRIMPKPKLEFIN